MLPLDSFWNKLERILTDREYGYAGPNGTAGINSVPGNKSRREGDSYEYKTNENHIKVIIYANNKSTDEIINEFVPKLKLAISNI